MSVEEAPPRTETDGEACQAQETADAASTTAAAQGGVCGVKQSIVEKSNGDDSLDSSNPNSPTSSGQEPKSETSREVDQPPLQNPKSKTHNGKRPYVSKQPFAQTPAQRAASMANMSVATT